MVGLSFTLVSYAQSFHREQEAVNDLIQRVFPEMSGHFKWIPIERMGECDRFEQEVVKNRLNVSASSPVAACRGIYDFIRQNGYGISSWTGNRLALPESLGESKVRQVVSPFAHHYYFNVVTYGYSMPYWDWERWEQEIDWMALHGIDMPLALVANEAISARVWKKMGLTEEEISAYFVGPAHLPWMRMGNISGVDGPMPKAWHEDQIALQHKILKRMRSLGMHPICPGFAGFVPKNMQRLYPDIQITETSWGGAFHNWMLSPQEELFHTIGKMFIEEWEKEFGKNEYYLVDSFNEMDIPFPSKDDPKRYTLLASYGDKVYQSIRAGNPNAVWVMQGWMFGYQRYIWDEPTLGALVSKVPDDKMLLLDLAVDYNRCFWKSEVNWEFYRGFFNKPWVYSVIPNMGGKSGMTGILDFYANGHLDALQSAHRGRLVAHGMAPEGIENNEVIYELLADAGWSDVKIDIRAWLKDYSVARYGAFNEGMERFWDGMLRSVYGCFTDHPRYNWQLRPGLVRQGTIHVSPDFYSGIEHLSEIAPQMIGNSLFERDFREWAVAYAGGKAEELTRRIEDAYQKRDTALVMDLEQAFCHLLLQMDRILEGHPTKDMQRWLDWARRYGKGNQSLADYYEKNARRIVTIWGPPVDDYSARIWSGLIRDYYLPRWQHYFEQKRTGRKFDFAQWERYWVEQQKGLSLSRNVDSPFLAAIKMVEDLKQNDIVETENQVLMTWDIPVGTDREVTLEWGISLEELRQIKGFLVTQIKERGAVEVLGMELVADGHRFTLGACPKLTTRKIVPITLPDAFTANNECKLKMILRRCSEQSAGGTVEKMK